MEIDEEYIDKVKKPDRTERRGKTSKTLLTDLHPADIAELCNDLAWRSPLRLPPP